MDKIYTKLALIFPGVGSQHPMMIKSFYDSSQIVRDTFAEANDVLGFDLKEICLSKSFGEELNKIDISQLALFTASTAVFRFFTQETGIVPDYCLGHSLGEYSALCAGGVMSFSDGLQLVRQRGAIIKEAIASIDGTMMWVINLDNKLVKEICEEHSRGEERIYISAYDTPTQCSISGSTAAINRAVEDLEKRGAIVYPLKLSGPFHCPMMAAAADKMREVLAGFRFEEPRCRVIANRSALPYEGADSVAENLSLQLVSPIRWQESIQYLVSNRVKTAIEIGPKDVLKFLVKKNTSEIEAFSFNNHGLLDTMRDKFFLGREQGLGIVGRCLKIAVSTENCNEDQEQYRRGAVIPYKKIEAMYEELVQSGICPDREQLQEAMGMAISVLDTKKIPTAIRDRKLEQILEGRILAL